MDYKWRGLQRLRENLGDENIDYQQHGGYELFMDDEVEDAEKCIGKISYLNKLLQQVIGGTDIYSISQYQNSQILDLTALTRMIYNPYVGQIHTGKMMRALLNKVYNLGVLVLNGCEIQRIEHETDHINLTTSQGNFKTGKVILATNAFANQLFPDLKVIPGRGRRY